MHKQRIAVTLCAGAGALGCFLPWVNLPIIGSVNGMQGSDGVIMLLLFAPAAIFALRPETGRPLRGGRLWAAVVPAAMAGLLGIWKIVDFHSGTSSLNQGNPFGSALSAPVSIGLGLYLISLAGLLCAVLGLRFQGEEVEEDSSSG
jgi:hypothetical protein